jgi:hypothetical protein
MKGSRFTEEQIIGILHEQEAGANAADVCRKHGISPTTAGQGSADTVSPIRTSPDKPCRNPVFAWNCLWITPRQLLTRHRGRSIGRASSPPSEDQSRSSFASADVRSAFSFCLYRLRLPNPSRDLAKIALQMLTAAADRRGLLVAPQGR